jgi:hypothetical protein
VDTVRDQKTATGPGYGSLEKANLLANASGQSFENIVAMHNAGEGWGKIAQDKGLTLGKLTSEATRHLQTPRVFVAKALITGRLEALARKALPAAEGHYCLGKARTSSEKGIGHVASGKSLRGSAYGACPA